MKSVHEIPQRIKKAVTNASAHIEFQIELHAIRFHLMFISCKNYSSETNYKYLKIVCYISITLYKAQLCLYVCTYIRKYAHRCACAF